MSLVEEDLTVINASRRTIVPAIRLPLLTALALLAALAVLFTPGHASAQSASRDATLSALTLSSGLSPSFEAGVTNYTSAVRNSTARVTVTPTRNDSNATLSYNSTDAHSDSGHQVDLEVGENVIVVSVTAADGVTVREYVIRVWRHPDVSSFVQSKISASKTSVVFLGGASNVSHKFTTGPSRHGYIINAATLTLDEVNSAAAGWGVAIHRNRDNSVVGEFNVSGAASTGEHTVPAYRPIHLEPNTDYRFMVWKKSGDWKLAIYASVTSGVADEALAPGWSIEAKICTRAGRACTGGTNGFMADFELQGGAVDATAPVLSSAIFQGNKITLTYDDLLDSGSVPLPVAFAVKVNSTAVNINSSAVSGHDVVLTLASPVASGATVTVDYNSGAIPPIRNLGLLDAAALSSQAVTAVHARKLKSLTVGGVMVPNFAPDTTSYTFDVPYERRGSINVTATAQHGDSYTKIRTNGNSWNGGHREPGTGYERLEVGANEITIRVHSGCCAPSQLATWTTYRLTINRAEPPSRFGPFVDNLPKGRHAGALVVDADKCLNQTGYNSACVAPLTRSERANTRNLAIKISVWPPESQGAMRGYRILRTRYEDGSAPSWRGFPYDTAERDDMIAGAGAITTLLPYTSTWIAHHDADIEHGYCYVYVVQAVGGTTANPVYAGAFNWVDAGTLSNTPRWNWELRPECIPSYTGSSAPEDAPAAPQNLAATAGEDSIALTWDASAGADSYRVLRRNEDAALYAEIGTTTTNSYTDTTAVVAQGYAYQVQARNDSGDSESSDHVLAMIDPPAPDAPTGLEADIGDGSVTLSWDASDDDTITSYMITRDVRGADPPETVLLRRDEGETTQVTDSSPEAGAAYTYSVMAINAGGRSEAATLDVDIPAAQSGLAAPTGLAATVSGGTVVLAWDAVADATGYNVLRQGPGETEHTQLAAPTTNAYTDTAVTVGSSYSYQVRAVDGDGAGSLTDAVTAAIPAPPDAPANVQATATSASVTLTWTAPTETLSGYFVYRKVRNADPPEEFAFHNVAGADATTYTDATVEADTAYAYYVVAARSALELSAPSATVEVDTPAESPFTGFTLVDASDQAVLATLTGGDSVALADPSGGSYGIGANLAEGQTVGSVKLELTGAKTVTRTENAAPYSLYGDSYEGDASDLYGQSLPAGSYTLTATAYSERSRGGDELGSLQVSFTVVLEDTDATRAGAVSLGAQSPDRGRQFFYAKSLDRAGGDGVDYYTFTTDGRYTLGLGVRDQSVELKVVLEDSNGSVVGTAGPPADPNKDQVYIEWLKTTIDAGTYYIRVEALADGATGYYVRFGLTAPEE